MLTQALLDTLAPLPIFYIFIGVALGCIVGAIPGLTGSMLIVLTLPLTFYMDSTLAMILLVAMYVGSISGGLITATLLRMPGTPSSIMTTLDGYPMAQQGKAGRALGIGIMASFVGGLVAWIFMVLVAPPLGRIAVKFGPFEYFSMVLMALVLISSVSEGSFLKGIISGLLGLLVATPGIDPGTAVPRMDFGFNEMAGGFHILPVLIGLFGISQIITDIINIDQRPEKVPMKFSNLFMSLRDLKKQAVNLIRSSVIGTWVGILPGIGANIGSIVAYGAAKNMSKTPEKFGTGHDEGIVASEAANNATVSGALIPLITLGIPGSIIDAILLGAMYIHNVQPGPLLFKTNPEMAYGVMSSALISNIFMLFIMVGATFFIAKIVDIHKAYIIPAIIVFCIVGSFALHNRMFDVWVMFGFGLLGFGLERCKVPLAPFIIGLILCPLAELPIRQGLMATDGSLAPLVTRPVSLIFLIISALTFVWTIYQEVRKSNNSKLAKA